MRLNRRTSASNSRSLHGKIHAGVSYRKKDRRTSSASNSRPLGTIVGTSYRITIGQEPLHATEEHRLRR